MIYADRRALQAILADDHAPAEMIVNNDLQPRETIGRLPTFDELRAAFDGGYGNRLNAKIGRAKQDASAFLVDVEPLSWHTGAALAHYSAVTSAVVNYIRESCPTLRIMLYAHCGRDDRLNVGRARIKDGHNWWSLPRIKQELADRARRVSAVAGQLRRSHGSTPRIGVYDLVDVISPVCYQSTDFPQYQAVDTLPPVLERALSDNRPLIPMVSAHTPDGRLADAAELDSTCGIIKGYGIRSVYEYEPWDADLDAPGVRENIDIIRGHFA